MKERLSDGWKEWILGLKNNFEICFQSLPQMSYCNNVCMRWIICCYKRWECSRRDSRAWEHGPLLCLGHLHVEFSQTCSGELCRWSKKEVFTSCYTITLLHRFRKVFKRCKGWRKVPLKRVLCLKSFFPIWRSCHFLRYLQFRSWRFSNRFLSFAFLSEFSKSELCSCSWSLGQMVAKLYL